MEPAWQSFHASEEQAIQPSQVSMSVLAALGRASGSFDSSQTVAREGHAAEIASKQMLGELWGSPRKEHACVHMNSCVVYKI